MSMKPGRSVRFAPNLKMALPPGANIYPLFTMRAGNDMENGPHPHEKFRDKATYNSCSGKLRDEIMNYQAAQREAGRWGLVGLSALAAIGLGAKIFGIEPSADEYRSYVLCAMPLFAAYCDAIRREYDVRIAIISNFLQTVGGIYGDYENFIHADRIRSTQWWHLARCVNLVPSVSVCLFVFSIGLIKAGLFKADIKLTQEAILLVAFSIIGVIAIRVVEEYYESLVGKIRRNRREDDQGNRMKEKSPGSTMG